MPWQSAILEAGGTSETAFLLCQSLLLIVTQDVETIVDTETEIVYAGRWPIAAVGRRRIAGAKRQRILVISNVNHQAKYDDHVGVGGERASRGANGGENEAGR